jgi:hypothetical protein
MYLPFECKRCYKDKWMIRFNTEDKSHRITCASCGHIEILEEIFNNKRRPSNAKPKRTIQQTEPIERA